MNTIFAGGLGSLLPSLLFEFLNTRVEVSAAYESKLTYTADTSIQAYGKGNQ